MSYYFKVIIPLFLLAALLTLGVGTSLPPWLFSIAGGIFFAWSGYLIARYFIPSDHITTLACAPLCLVPIGILGSIAYFPFSFGDGIIRAMVFLPPIIILFLTFFKGFEHDKTIENHFSLSYFLSISRLDRALVLLYGLFTVAYFLIISHGVTKESVLGPWDQLQADFFVLFTLRTLLLVVIAFRKPSSQIFLPLAIVHTFSAVSLFQFIFPLNYGFDPFIHQATETLIANQGFVEPKQPYYTGFYVLVVFLSKVLHLSIASVNQWLVPVSISLLLPVFFLRVTNSKPIHFAILIFLLFPFSGLVSATPWGLSFLFFLLTLISGFLFLRTPNVRLAVLLFSLALFTTVVHPIAGLPALGFSFITLGIWHYATYLRHRLVSMLFILTTFFATTLALPVSFLINSLRGSLDISLGFFPQWHVITDMLSSIIPLISSRFNAPLDFTYAIASLAPLLLLSLFLIGSRTLVGREKIMLWSYGLMAISLIVTITIFLMFVRFEGLVSHEQLAYVDRLSLLVMATLLPLAVLGFLTILNKIFSIKLLILKTAFIFLLVVAMTASLYGSYPKMDAFAAYHGYSVSKYDIAAVTWIHERSQSGEYAVLTTQPVAAAAIGTYGFAHYFSKEIDGKNQSIFYYPVPTTSPLYAFYTSLVEKPSMAPILEAQALLQSDIFVVVPSYEKNSKEIDRVLSPFADDRQIIEDKVTIYRFNYHPL